MSIASFLRRFSLVIVIAGAAVALALPGVSASTQGADKSVFVAVADASGNPVTDMKVSEFAVREDNVNREVVGLKPASQPLYLYLLADTSRQAGNTGMMGKDSSSGGTELIRDIRSTLLEAVKSLYAKNTDAQMALMEFGQAAITITKFTNKQQDVEKGISRLFPKPDAGSVILEALVEAAKNLAKAPSYRRAMISINIEPGEEESRQQPQQILDALRESGASLWSISLQKGQARNPSRDIVLERLTKISGGQREFLMGPSAIQNMLNKYVSLLASQYELTYKRPASSAAVQGMQVGVTRMGVTLHAGVFAPK
jgi:hypothetical protein